MGGTKQKGVVSLFVAGVENLAPSSSLGKGVRVGNGILLTDDHQLVSSLLSAELTVMIGFLEAQSLAQLPIVAFRRFYGDPFDAEQSSRFILENLATLGTFLHRLWQIRDHAANVEFGFLASPQEAGLVTRQSFRQGMTTADGGRPLVTFTVDELQAVARGSDTFDVVIEPQPFASKDVSRFQRALYFVQSARSTGDLGVKVANYCGCLEALFSSDSSELTHKLSERVASFLAPGDRIPLYRRVKQAYALRSRVVHGSGGAELEELRRVSVDCDTWIRALILKITGDPNLFNLFHGGHRGQVEDYMLQLTLGTTNSDSTPSA